MDLSTHFIGEVKLDFSAYDAKDSYSDGDIEDEILFQVKTGNTEEFLRSDNRWPVIYHLSPLRNFLLEWLPIEQGDTVLEIGCGCGAVTGALLSKGAFVEAVELSPRRAQICALRNRKEKNLTIHVGNLNAMTFDKRFDFVLLIGVLEYAGKFIQTQNPQADFLNNCKSFLKPDGALVIAIENRLGIEYLSGKPEDHTGNLFDGITDYPQSNGIKTLSRLELKNLLNSCGFVDQKFFYPYPDYKFPYFIHSDKMLPTDSDFAHFPDTFYDVNRPQLFPLSRALPTIINAGLYQDLANSFLIVASQTPQSRRIYPLKVFANNCPRKPKYQIRTEIHAAPTASGLVVKKIARNPLAREHLNAMVENCKIFSEAYGAERVAQMKLISPDVAEMEYVEGILLEDYLCNILKTTGGEDFVQGLAFYLTYILRGSEADDKFSDDIIDFNAPNRKYELDLNFRNIVVRYNDFVVFDYEFLLPVLPKKFVAWRAFHIFFHNCWELCQRYALNEDTLIATLRLPADLIAEYKRQDRAVMDTLVDKYDERYKKMRVPIKGFKFD